MFVVGRRHPKFVEADAGEIVDPLDGDPDSCPVSVFQPRTLAAASGCAVVAANAICQSASSFGRSMAMAVATPARSTIAAATNQSRRGPASFWGAPERIVASSRSKPSAGGVSHSAESVRALRVVAKPGTARLHAEHVDRWFRSTKWPSGA